jgi:hypothetical protein
LISFGAMPRAASAIIQSAASESEVAFLSHRRRLPALIVDVHDPHPAADPRADGGFVPSNDPAAQAAAMRQRLLGKSVIDFVNGDINRLRARLAPPSSRSWISTCRRCPISRSS